MKPDNNHHEIKIETAVIGGGMAGLACSRQLHDAGKDFALITDNLGGRIHHSKRGVYFGAVIMTKDYTNIQRYATKAVSLYPWSGYFWNGQKAVNSAFLLDFKKLFHFAKILKQFQQSIIRLRREAPYTCQKELMGKDPLLKHMVKQSATDFVKEHGLEKMHERMLNATVNIACFRPPKELNAFNYCILILATGNGACFADFTQTVAKLTKGFEDKICLEKVTSLEENEKDSTFTVRANGHAYYAQNVVIATPARNTTAFYNKAPNEVMNNPIHVIHVKGKRRKIYKPGKNLTFKPGNAVECFFAQKNGIDILYATTPKPDFEKYYHHYEIVDQIAWKTGTQLSANKWRPLQMKKNLFTIGDYNICGLEDSFLTGLFAANKIITKQ